MDGIIGLRMDASCMYPGYNHGKQLAAVPGVLDDLTGLIILLLFSSQ